MRVIFLAAKIIVKGEQYYNKLKPKIAGGMII